MKNLKMLGMASLAAAICCSTAPAYADAVNISAGSNGIALEYYLGLSPKLNARFALSDMPLSYEADIDDIEYDIEYDRTNLSMLFDYRPMSGTFHLTSGIYVGDHDLNLSASATGVDYEVGDKTYTSQSLKLESQVGFGKAAPYFGLGWGNSTQGKGFTANLDIGVLYLGKATVAAEASGQAIDKSTGSVIADVSTDPVFQENLAKERAELEDDVKDVKFAPVIQFGIGYKF